MELPHHWKCGSRAAFVLENVDHWLTLRKVPILPHQMTIRHWSDCKVPVKSLQVHPYKK